MEIKTITSPRVNPVKDFDEEVNKALHEGFRLVRRETLPGFEFGINDYSPVYYAELVKPDKPAREPDGPGVIEHLQAVAMFCAARPNCEGCPLNPFCGKHLANNEGPADWVLPEGEPDNDPA